MHRSEVIVYFKKFIKKIVPPKRGIVDLCFFNLPSGLSFIFMILDNLSKFKNIKKLKIKKITNNCIIFERQTLEKLIFFY